MKDFDYIIIGGGCAGLSLAYELDINKKLKDKTLAIIEPDRMNIRKIKLGLFGRFLIIILMIVSRKLEEFSINLPSKTKHLKCDDYPYQSIDSGLFYEKIINKLKENKNINFLKILKN